MDIKPVKNSTTVISSSHKYRQYYQVGSNKSRRVELFEEHKQDLVNPQNFKNDLHIIIEIE